LSKNLERISTNIIISSQAGGGGDPGLYICMKRILKSLHRFPLPYSTGIISPLYRGYSSSSSLQGVSRPTVLISPFVPRIFLPFLSADMSRTYRNNESIVSTDIPSPSSL
jgi:hypothetical protein